jgi:hypothetical protein
MKGAETENLGSMACTNDAEAVAFGADDQKLMPQRQALRR